MQIAMAEITAAEILPGAIGTCSDGLFLQIVWHDLTLQTLQKCNHIFDLCG